MLLNQLVTMRRRSLGLRGTIKSVSYTHLLRHRHADRAALCQLFARQVEQLLAPNRILQRPERAEDWRSDPILGRRVELSALAFAAGRDSSLSLIHI